MQKFTWMHLVIYKSFI